jgi:hypothetical protein
LQAVDAKLFEEVIFGGERARGQLKMPHCQVEHFLRSLFERAHVSLNLSFSLREEKLSLAIHSP